MATSAAYIDLDEGAAPSAPPSATARLYTKADGLLYWKDDANTEYPVGSSSTTVATDPIWDAAGDLAVGSGSNTAARLAIGATNGMTLQRVSGAVAWDLPPGFEFDYVQITGNVTISGTAEASETTVITGTSQAYAAVPTLIEVCTGRLDIGSHASGNGVVVVLYDGATFVGRLGFVLAPASTGPSNSFYAAYRLTPSAATHQYIVKAYRTNANCTWAAGAGGSGTHLPSFLRITKV